MRYADPAQFRSGRVRPLWGLVLAVGLSLAPPAQALTPGDVLVVDPSVGTGGTLFVVDPATGRTVLSDFSMGANPGSTPHGVAVEADGTILVIDEDRGTDNHGALRRVDPMSGARTVLSDFGIGANPGQAPFGVAVVPDTTPPDTSLTSTPPNPDTSTSPSFGFTGTDDATPPPASASNASSTGRASAPAPVPRPMRA